MEQFIKYVGLDGYKEIITVAVADTDGDASSSRKFQVFWSVNFEIGRLVRAGLAAGIGVHGPTENRH